MKKIYTYILSLLIFTYLASCDLTPDLNNNDFNPAITELRISLGDIPLNDPDSFTYNDLNGGLYPWGNALIENDYKTNYIGVSRSVKPLDSAGLISSTGKVVILGIGGSHAYDLYNAMESQWTVNPQFAKRLVLANAGTGGKDLPDIVDPGASYWGRINKILDSNFVTAAQVQVIFCIEDDFVNKDTTIQRAYQIRDQYITLLETIRLKYPNCKLILIADRGFAGYSTLSKYDEPKGYLNGWAVKFLMEDFINGVIPQSPFIGWLDYYWAYGETARWDGMSYSLTDFVAPEYAHLTEQKAAEIGASTHNKLRVDAGALYWYK